MKSVYNASALMLTIMVSACTVNQDKESPQLQCSIDTCEFVPLKIQTPDPCIVLRGDLPDDLNADRGKFGARRQGPIYVPRKANQNIAEGQPGRASSPPDEGKLRQVADGDKSLSPEDETSLVVLPRGLQYVEIDLGADTRIFALVIWHDYCGDLVYRDVIVRISNDQNFDEATTIFNNDHDESSNIGLGKGADHEYLETYQGKMIAVPGGVTGQYLRFYSRGSTAHPANHYLEIETYGFPRDTK